MTEPTANRPAQDRVWTIATWSILLLGGAGICLAMVVVMLMRNISFNEENFRVTSPDGYYDALVYTHVLRGGPGYAALIVSICPRGTSLDDLSMIGPPIFSMEDHHAVTIRWKDARNLQVAYPGWAKPDKTETKSGEVRVTYLARRCPEPTWKFELEDLDRQKRYGDLPADCPKEGEAP